MQAESRKRGWRSWAGRYQGSDLKPEERNLKEAQGSLHGTEKAGKSGWYSTEQERGLGWGVIGA